MVAYWVSMAVLLVAAQHVSGQTRLCTLTLQVVAKQSPWTSKGDTTVPFPAVIRSPPMDAVGKVYVAVPRTSSCPPDLTAANAVTLFERSSLLLPIGDSSVAFKPVDIKGNVTAVDAVPGSTGPRITFDFDGLGLGFTGNEPFGQGAVKLGTGSASEAKAVAEPLCSQLVLLTGTLNLTSLLGPRTANVTNVAYNRSLNAGVSLKKEGNNVSNVVLYLGNASMLLNISPETVPGVEVTRGKYLLSGDIVATADLSDVDSWEEVDASEADWSKVNRLDNPVIIGGRVAYPRFYGVNATTPAACTAKRALDAGGSLTAAAPSADSTPTAGPGASSPPAAAAAGTSSSSVWLMAAGAVAAFLAVL